MLGLILALGIGPIIGWRNVFLLTGTLGIVLAVVIYFTVRDLQRGQSEPELAELSDFVAPKFSWSAARSVLRKRTLIPLFIQGFFGVFPLNIFSFWFFDYLKRERGYSDSEVLPTMVLAVLAMAFGAFIGGMVGDFLFKRTARGRLIVASVGVTTAAVLMVVTLNVPAENRLLFGGLLALNAFFILFSGPNVASTVYDITVPEVRSTALAVQYFIESIGAASAPLLVGLLAERIGTLGQSILIISLSTYALCALFLVVAVILVPPDIHALRLEMRQRADALQAAMA
jgi:predicted MFS family arabinose efflux permease